MIGHRVQTAATPPSRDLHTPTAPPEPPGQPYASQSTNAISRTKEPRGRSWRLLHDHPRGSIAMPSQRSETAASARLARSARRKRPTSAKRPCAKPSRRTRHAWLFNLTALSCSSPRVHHLPDADKETFPESGTLQRKRQRQRLARTCHAAFAQVRPQDTCRWAVGPPRRSRCVGRRPHWFARRSYGRTRRAQAFRSPQTARQTLRSTARRTTDRSGRRLRTLGDTPCPARWRSLGHSSTPVPSA